MLGILKHDLRGVQAAVRRRSLSASGMHVYKVADNHTKRCFHLRFGNDGSAVLLVDAADAIHMNSTAAFLTYCALEGMATPQAAKSLRKRFRGVSHPEALRQTERVYRMVEHLKTTTDACPACGLSELHWAKPFAMPVSAPYKADLALSYGCNNACSHCYNGSRRPADDATLSLSQWQEVLARLAAIGVPHVIFTGGEPTLFEGLNILIRTAHELGLVTGMNTNGRRLADRAFVASLQDAGLDHVQITLESHDPAVHNAMTCADSFAETLSGIHNAIGVGLHTLTNTTLTRRNVHQAAEIVDYLHLQGLATFAMNGMIHAGRGQSNADALPIESLGPVLQEVRHRAARYKMRFLWYTPTPYCRFSPLEFELGPRRCNAGEYSMCIEPNGDVLPCQSYYTPAGNLLRDSWLSLWESELFLSFRRRVVDPAGCGLPERCHTCPDLPLCAGGCRLEQEAL